MKTKFLSILMAVLAVAYAGNICLTSCQKEEPKEESQEEPQEEPEKPDPTKPDEGDDCVIGADVSVEGMTPINESKSAFAGGGKSKTELDALENTINNMTLFQFYTNDGVEPSAYAGTLKHVYYASTPDEVKSFKLYGKSGATYNFYAVANCGDWSGKLTKQSSTADDLKNINYTNESISYLTASTGLPLVMPTAQSLTFAGTSKLAIHLKQLTARVEVIINASKLNTEGNSFEASSLEIKNANKTNAPFKFNSNKATSASDLVTSDYTVGDDVTNLTSGTGVYFYCLENAQDTPDAWKDNSDASKKIPDNFGDLCTYLELKGIYTAANGRVSHNTYRVMLGGNNTNDVHVYGGKSYEVTLNLSAAGAEKQTWKSESNDVELRAYIRSEASSFPMSDGETYFNAYLVWCTLDSQGEVTDSTSYTGTAPTAYSWYSNDEDILIPSGENSSVQVFSYGSMGGEVSIGVDVSFADRPVVNTEDIYINSSDTPVEEITTEDNRYCRFNSTSIEVSTDGTAKTVTMYPNYTGYAKVRMEPVSGFKYQADGMSSMAYSTSQPEFTGISVARNQDSSVLVAYTGTASSASTTVKSGVTDQSGYDATVLTVTAKAAVTATSITCTFTPNKKATSGKYPSGTEVTISDVKLNYSDGSSVSLSSSQYTISVTNLQGASSYVYSTNVVVLDGYNNSSTIVVKHKTLSLQTSKKFMINDQSI